MSVGRRPDEPYYGKRALVWQMVPNMAGGPYYGGRTLFLQAVPAMVGGSYYDKWILTW